MTGVQTCALPISADQERLVVDAYVRYQINDPLQYFRTLRTTRDGEITSVAKEAAAHAEGPLPPDRPRRRCPECRNHLRKSAIAGVQIDSCSTHGTWFDRGEVEAIYAAAKKPGTTSFGDIAVGVLEVFGALASAL